MGHREWVSRIGPRLSCREALVGVAATPFRKNPVSVGRARGDSGVSYAKEESSDWCQSAFGTNPWV